MFDNYDTGWSYGTPTKREDEYQCESPKESLLDEINARLIRVETRLCQFIQKMGFDPHEIGERK